MSSWVGIDVSKNTLAVWVRPSGVNFIVCNSSEGHQALLLNLADIQVERVLLEATGGYERAVMRPATQSCASTPDALAPSPKPWENWLRPTRSMPASWRTWPR